MDLRQIARDAARSLGLSPRSERVPQAEIDRAVDDGLFSMVAEEVDAGLQREPTHDEALGTCIDAGIPTVRVLSDRSNNPHPVCYGADGTEMPPREALRLRALPHALPDGAECRCVYLPIIR